MSSTSPTHSTIPWCPSLDDRNINPITIPQLPFPLTPRSTTASKTSQSTPGSSNTTNSYTTSSSLPSPSTSPSLNTSPLFCSDFLKQSIAPSATESRPGQRNLGRLIAQTWNMMDPTQKQILRDKAMKEAVMCRERFSRPKFTPAPRGSRAAKNKSNKNGRLMEEEITLLREIYTPLKGPAPLSSKNRRPKRARSVGVDNRFPPTFRHLITEVETPPHGPPTSPLSLPPQTPSMMQAFSSMMISPQLTHTRHPSTSLGFNKCVQDEMLSPFMINQGEKANYLIHNQNMVDSCFLFFRHLCIVC